MVVFATDALVAQWQSSRLLTGRLQVQVLPGALGKKDVMERVISLFRKPEEFEFFEPPEEEQNELGLEEQEPEYFQQLLEYLRERNSQFVREGAD
jgi:hypothetical protein